MMENYELSCEDIKQIDWVTSQVRDWLSGIKKDLEQNQPAEGDKNQPAEGDKNQPAEGDKNQPAEGDKNQSVEGDKNQSVEGDKNQSAEGDKNQPAEGDKNQSVEGDKNQSVDTKDLFYEINDKKVILKMDIVKSYLENIKDKEWDDLKSANSGAWIMAVQIALRSPHIWWGNKDKYWDIVIDGILWPKTKDAVEKFQTENKLEKIDGLPGKETMNKIYEILTWKVQAAPAEEKKSEWEKSDIDSKENSWEKTNENNVDNNWGEWNSKEVKEKEPKDSDIVSIEEYTKWTWILMDIRYATSNNFTKKVVYKGDDAVAKLRYWTIKKLIKAQEDVKKQWYSLKIWDGYRSDDAQEFLFKNKPNGLPVAKPNKLGGKWSQHARWNTVDITLVKANWEEIPMPSEFDSNKTKIIDRDYGDLNSDQRKNVKILENAMKKAWFSCLQSEWWHYSDNKLYPHQWKLKN